jgi:hypothetical protein
MSDNQLFLITGIIILAGALFVIYLDRRSKNKGPIKLGEIGLPLRILCFICGAVTGCMVIFEAMTTGQVTIIFVGLTFLLIVCAFYPGKRKEENPTSTYSSLQYPSIGPYETYTAFPNIKQKHSIIKKYKNPFSNSLVRIISILIAIVLVIYGAFWLATHPVFMDKYGWIIILIVFLIYGGLRLVSIIRLMRGH